MFWIALFRLYSQALTAAALGAIAFVGPVVPAEPKTRVSLRASVKEPLEQAVMPWIGTVVCWNGWLNILKDNVIVCHWKDVERLFHKSSTNQTDSTEIYRT